MAGDPAQSWLVLENGRARIGLFVGVFEGNLVTFNPPDARAVQDALQGAGYPIEKEAEPGEGPTHFIVRDPAGNPILVDQH